MKQSSEASSLESKENLEEWDKQSRDEIALIEYNLSLSYEERLLNHQRALDTVNELIEARKQLYGES